MNEIVCATRGGEGSRAVQMAAVARAKETGRPLVFLYVAAPSILGKIDATLETAVHEELTWMGKALLSIAQQRAHAANLEARMVIREGSVEEEITRYLQQRHASLLLLGAPRGATANVFGDDAVERFAESIRTTTGIDVEIVRPKVNAPAQPYAR